MWLDEGKKNRLDFLAFWKKKKGGKGPSRGGEKSGTIPLRYEGQKPRKGGKNLYGVFVR